MAVEEDDGAVVAVPGALEVVLDEVLAGVGEGEEAGGGGDVGVA
ncbi:MAG TPA: hypothetical protein VLA67_01190 [Nitrospiraceae bacterium]|nr:hypothetical protein [Nitrospiraceae bacterium]